MGRIKMVYMIGMAVLICVSCKKADEKPKPAAGMTVAMQSDGEQVGMSVSYGQTQDVDVTTQNSVNLAYVTALNTGFTAVKEMKQAQAEQRQVSHTALIGVFISLNVSMICLTAVKVLSKWKS